MNTYKIIIAYDGTSYCGWQIQPHCPTIALLLQQRFNAVFKKNIKLLGASRTDAGVHALGQVACGTTDLNLDVISLQHAWNNVLPPDIVIRSITHVDSFRPHQNIDYKLYYYHFFLERPLPFMQRYGWFFRRPVAIDTLQKALALFVGTHDFRSFCTGNEHENTVRTIDAITVTYIRRFNVYRIVFKGPAFLRYMIRRIVGACLEVASRDSLSLDCLTTALQKKDPQQTLPNAPSKGLLLYKIVYKEV